MFFCGSILPLSFVLTLISFIVAPSLDARESCALRLADTVPSSHQLEAPKVHVVIEGMGDVVDRYYSEALERAIPKLRGNRRVTITFLDDSRFWRGNPALEEKMERVRQKIQAWGGHYLDKSARGADKRIRELHPDIVVIATPDFTHARLAKEWLERDSGIQEILVEKPLDASLRAAEELSRLAAGRKTRVLAFDHYRARLLPDPAHLQQVMKHLGGGLSEFTFYFLEDHSGADPRFQGEVQRDGAIENEQRTKALAQGLMMDLMSHVPPLLEYFGALSSVEITRVRAGQYTGVDGNPDQRTEIRGETFADVGFVFKDRQGNDVRGTAYVGKGIRGVQVLGPDYDANAKVLDLVGKNGKRARFDLRSSGTGASKAYLFDEAGQLEAQFELNAKPYQVLFESILRGEDQRRGIALGAENGVAVLRILEAARAHVKDAVEKGTLPTFPGGMKGIRRALYLEEVLRRIAPLFERAPDSGTHPAG